MSLTPWKKLSSEIKVKHRWWTYRFDRCLWPNGKEGEYHLIESADCVIIVPKMDNGKFLMVRQFRYPHMRESLEFPCGSCRSDDAVEEPISAALRELAEEGGVTGILEQIGVFAPANAVLSQSCFVFQATELASQEKKPDASEEFEKVYLSAEDIEQKIRSGEIWDGCSLAAWTFFNLHD